ncbi:hypothetical protein BH20CHL7_BH20CHL7_12350 [soil metagenome]
MNAYTAFVVSQHMEVLQDEAAGRTPGTSRWPDAQDRRRWPDAPARRPEHGAAGRTPWRDAHPVSVGVRGSARRPTRKHGLSVVVPTGWASR